VGKICFFYAVPHPHAQETNILQHRACRENGQYHMEIDVLATLEHPTEPNPQAVLCSIRKCHIPKRTKHSQSAIKHCKNIKNTQKPNSGPKIDQKDSLLQEINTKNKKENIS
jgi:hypothetical protein